MLDSALLPLQDDRVRLRPLHRRDATAYAEGTNDPGVREYGHLPEPEYTPESVRQMIDRDTEPGLERGDLAVLAIADAETDQFVGSLVVFDVSDERAEVGFWVHPKHRGSGITSSALGLATRFARDCGLRELTARTLPENIASQRVLEEAGFALRGREVDTAPSGHWTELLEYSRPLREEPTGRQYPQREQGRARRTDEERAP